jgi:hypothetical protein
VSVEKYLKYVPLTLLTIYGLKMLVSPFSWLEVVCLGILGITAFLYEHNIQTKALLLLQDEKKTLQDDLNKVKEEITHIKAYVTSQKMSTLRVGNGQNK